jgi:hypothetical protein
MKRARFSEEQIIGVVDMRTCRAEILANTHETN